MIDMPETGVQFLDRICREIGYLWPISPDRAKSYARAAYAKGYRVALENMPKPYAGAVQNSWAVLGEGKGKE